MKSQLVVEYNCKKDGKFQKEEKRVKMWVHIKMEQGAYVYRTKWKEKQGGGIRKEGIHKYYETWGMMPA